MATVLPILLAVPLSFMMSITMAMIFLAAVRELKTGEFGSRKG